MSKKIIDFNESINEALVKPNNGVLIVELSTAQAVAVHDYISQLTASELLPFHPDATTGLHKILDSLEDTHKVD